MPDVRIVRKDRIDRSGLEDKIKRGPTHQVPEGGYNQTWCGVKIVGIASWGRGDPADVDCVKCQRAVAKGQPRSWRR